MERNGFEDISCYQGAELVVTKLKKIKLVVLPKATNPYQSLLYSPMKTDVDIVYGKNSSYKYPFMLLLERLRGTRLLHLHWLYWLSVPLPWQKLQQLVSTVNIYFFLMLCKILGFKIVWTVHNVLPHEKQTNNDLAIAKKLSNQSAGKIVHSNYAIQQMKEIGLDTTGITIIPHGNYITSYKNTVSRRTARQKLGISNSETVILFFGLIRQHKGIEELLEAFKHISSNHKSVRLVIAGSCNEPALLKTILTATKTCNVSFYEGFVPDDEVQIYFNASDVVCLPFKAVTTSGSTLLALSFGKAIVAPLAGALTDLPKGVGYLYTSAEGLENALGSALKQKSKLSHAGGIGFDYAKSLDWNMIAHKTLKLYEDVL